MGESATIPGTVPDRLVIRCFGCVATRIEAFAAACSYMIAFRTSIISVMKNARSIFSISIAELPWLASPLMLTHLSGRTFFGCPAMMTSTQNLATSSKF
jgi:hypothetical protein